MPDIGTYLSFVMNMFLAFGVTFEVPVVVVILVADGHGDRREAQGDPPLRHRGRVRHRAPW